MSTSETRDLELVRLVPVARLVVEVQSGPDQGTRVEGERIRAGTAADNDVVLTDDAVSKYHVELVGTDAGVQIRDLGSTNGTIAGGLRLGSVLAPLDTTIQVGRTQLVVGGAKPAVVELHDDTSLGGTLHLSLIHI